MDDGLPIPIYPLLFLASTLSVVAVLILLAAFVYLLRRRSARSVLLPKFSGEPRKSPSNLCLFFLRVKGTSFQVEPAGADEVKLLECCDMGPSRAAGDGVVEGREFQQAYSHGRLLYTIKEEKETESESEDESFWFVGASPSVGGGGSGDKDGAGDGRGGRRWGRLLLHPVLFAAVLHAVVVSASGVQCCLGYGWRGGRRGVAGVEGGRCRLHDWRSGTRGARMGALWDPVN